MAYRNFEGAEITPDFVDELVEEWHANEMPVSLEKFVQSNTGWALLEYDNWALTGQVPEEKANG